jgi:Lar family restriction alleviation protein
MTETTNEQLKPCPFCGADVELISGFEPLRSHFVDCKCGASSSIFGTADGAIAAWNRRAAAVQAPAQPVDERKAFKEWHYKNGEELNSLIASFPCTGECPQPYNGCTCSCHRMPGVKHIMPCCYPSEDAAPASAAQTDEQDKRDAERYRWLIANASLCCDPHDAVQLILDVPTSTGPGWQDRAGAYIDAALSASKDQA